MHPLRSPFPPGRILPGLVFPGLIPGLLLAAGCAQETPARPTVVLVSLDTTRADHLSPYGYRRETTPFLSRLAAGSRVFDVGVPTATWTLPSHASIFTGLDPAEHGCWVRLDDVPQTGTLPTLSPDLPLLTTRLAEAGYHQIAAVGGAFTAARYGLLRDFDAHLDPGEAWELPASELNRWLFGQIAHRPRDRPLFVFVNYFDAHAPYDPPAGSYPFPEDGRPLPAVPPLEQLDPGGIGAELVRDAVDQYDRELLVQDRALEALVGALELEGLLEDCLIVVVGDHGEMFGEQPGVFGHGCLPFDPVARVPLLVRRTGGPVDRILEPVSLANVPATILGELGLPPLPGGGTPRFNLLDLPEGLPPAFVEHRGLDTWVGVLRGPRFKYACLLDEGGRPVAGEGEMLFDLGQPGGERAPVELADHPELVRDRRSALEELVARWRPAPSAPAAELTDHELERLHALGYGGQDE